MLGGDRIGKSKRCGPAAKSERPLLPNEGPCHRLDKAMGRQGPLGSPNTLLQQRQGGARRVIAGFAKQRRRWDSPDPGDAQDLLHKVCLALDVGPERRYFYENFTGAAARTFQLEAEACKN